MGGPTRILHSPTDQIAAQPATMVAACAAAVSQVAARTTAFRGNARALRVAAPVRVAARQQLVCKAAVSGAGGREPAAAPHPLQAWHGAPSLWPARAACPMGLACPDLGPGAGAGANAPRV